MNKKLSKIDRTRLSKKNKQGSLAEMSEKRPKVQAIRIMRTKPYETIDVSAYLKKKE